MPYIETHNTLASDDEKYQVWTVVYGAKSFLVKVDDFTGKVTSYRACNSSYQYRGTFGRGP